MEETLQQQQNEKRYPNGYPIRNGLTLEEYKLMSKEERDLKFPFGYVSSTGITNDEYQSMSSDEKKLNYPYGCTVYQDIVTPITLEQHERTLETERILTENLMKEKRLKVNQNLRDKFPDSFFFPICYDSSIVGINPVTLSVIYDCMDYGHLYIMFVEWSCPKYKDVMYGSTNVIRCLPDYDFKDKVPPTLILQDSEQFNKYWEDLQYPGW